MFVLELKMTDLNWGRITQCQNDAQKGIHAQALAGFIQWLARRYDQVRSDLGSEMAARRRRAPGSAVHRRIPTIISNLELGLDTWLKYADEPGALTCVEADALWDRGLPSVVAE